MLYYYYYYYYYYYNYYITKLISLSHAATLLTRGFLPANMLCLSKHSLSSLWSCGCCWGCWQYLSTSWRRGAGTGWSAMLLLNS